MRFLSSRLKLIAITLIRVTILCISYSHVRLKLMQLMYVASKDSKHVSLVMYVIKKITYEDLFVPATCSFYVGRNTDKCVTVFIEQSPVIANIHIKSRTPFLPL
jgi:hypothetical protein